MKQLDIHVGDEILFTSFDGKRQFTQKAVIWQVDNQDWFHACVLFEQSDTEALNGGAVGDIRREDIKEVIDRWDADRFMAAVRAGEKITGFRWPEDELTKIQTEMKNPSHKEKL